MAVAVGSLQSIGRRLASYLSKDVVESVGSFANGAVDGYIMGKIVEAQKGVTDIDAKALATALTIKNIAIPALVLLGIEDGYGFMKGMAKGSLYFWGMIFTIPGKEET
jgi:hypothetical protein